MPSLCTELPFFAHVAVETIAAASFLLDVERQLPHLTSTALPPPTATTPSSDETQIRIRIRDGDRLVLLGQEARLVLYNFSGLLQATNAIALVFATRSSHIDLTTTRLVAAAFAYWHLWPCYRAIMRLRWMRLSETTGPSSAPASTTSKTLGGPAVHLGVHLVLCASFVWATCTGISGRPYTDIKSEL